MLLTIFYHFNHFLNITSTNNIMIMFFVLKYIVYKSIWTNFYLKE